MYWSDQGRWGRTHIPTRVSNPIDLAVDAAKTSSNRGRVGGWRTPTHIGAFTYVCVNWWEVVSCVGRGPRGEGGGGREWVAVENLRSAELHWQSNLFSF